MSIENISIDQIAIAIPIIIGVVQGIKKGFGITSKTINLIITIFICLTYMVYLLYQNNEIVTLCYYFIILIFGATGIYNFLPKQNNENYVEANYTENQVFENEKGDDQ